MTSLELVGDWPLLIRFHNSEGTFELRLRKGFKDSKGPIMVYQVKKIDKSGLAKSGLVNQQMKLNEEKIGDSLYWGDTWIMLKCGGQVIADFRGIHLIKSFEID